MRIRPVSSLIAVLLWILVSLAPATAGAAANTSTIAGTVQTSDGAPLADATVTIEGQVRMTTASDAKGAFTFSSVPAGLYTLVVTKPGFQTYRDDDVAAFTGNTETINVALAQASFSSLRTIANISTRVPGQAKLNESTASISVISNQAFADQGQQQVTKILNETPGIITSPYSPGNGNPSNGASPASLQTPQIRGALPYETESLIDGHPVSVGAAGYYSPNLLNPWLLQDVELVKGPGSMPQEINYAINGTVNYRTLQPTAQHKQSAMFGYDNWGGLSTGFKATGSTPNHKIGYAIGYVTNGAPGPLKNFSYNATQLPLVGGPVGGPYYINGQQVAMIGSPVGLGVGSPAFAPYDGMGVSFVEPLTGCCYSMQTGYHSNSELAKLHFNFSNSTSLTVSYLGGQSVNGNGDPGAYSVGEVADTALPAAYFAPCGTANGALNCNPFASGTPYDCANTSGGPACNSAVPFDISSINGLGYTWTQQNLFQGEFRTTLGSTGTVLARYYTGSLNQYALLGPSGAQVSYSLNAYGTIPLCPAGTAFDTNPNTLAGGTDPNGWLCVGSGGVATPPVNTTFTGQKTSFSTVNEANTFTTNDSMNGETLEVQELLGQNTVTLAYDRSEQASAETANEPSVGIVVFSPVKGSKQTFQTVSLRGNVTLNPKLQLNLGDYFINYRSHYSIDGGTTWNDVSHAYNEPRAALEFRPNADTAYRFSTGGSVAPPYISLISSGGPSWSAIIGGVPAAGWLQDANNGAIEAETAWGYDFGIDRRIERSTSVALDLYLTQLHNLFLTQTAAVTGAAAAGCPNQPCEVSKTANLGQARYEGVELAIDHAPLFGLGWKAQGSLQKAFTYNLPPYFYCAGSTDPNTGVTTPPGPGCLYNTNLAVLPEVNFGGQPTALAGSPNGIGSARVPYALGYGELNWTGHYGQYYNLGLTYFGNNNSYNVPPFAVLSANARLRVNDRGTSLQFSADNLTNAYGNKFVGFFNGTPLPLVGGAMQISPLTGAYVPTSLAATPQGNYGPANFRIIFVQDF
ncbi:MAG TPA: TonB-dependent receptor [Candidatus Baltobacteraceae bacterium]|nr:TonB-dependent receptor [Candidatus Baltobacteraceae bacterium]